jgi:hypothetical protein
MNRTAVFRHRHSSRTFEAPALASSASGGCATPHKRRAPAPAFRASPETGGFRDQGNLRNDPLRITPELAIVGSRILRFSGRGSMPRSSPERWSTSARHETGPVGHRPLPSPGGVSRSPDVSTRARRAVRISGAGPPTDGSARGVIVRRQAARIRRIGEGADPSLMERVEQSRINASPVVDWHGGSLPLRKDCHPIPFYSVSPHSFESPPIVRACSRKNSEAPAGSGIAAAWGVRPRMCSCQTTFLSPSPARPAYGCRLSAPVGSTGRQSLPDSGQPLDAHEPRATHPFVSIDLAGVMPGGRFGPRLSSGRMNLSDGTQQPPVGALCRREQLGIDRDPRRVASDLRRTGRRPSPATRAGLPTGAYHSQEVSSCAVSAR